MSNDYDTFSNVIPNGDNFDRLFRDINQNDKN